MIDELKRLKETHPAWHFDLKITESYKAIRSADPVEYSDRVMNTKISMAPRGTSFETFRFFEALRSGCIVISEFLPSGWFYDGAPAIRLSNWSELGPTLQRLLSDPAALEKMHQDSLDWWREKCSESALGAYIASKLNAMSERTMPAYTSRETS